MTTENPRKPVLDKLKMWTEKKNELEKTVAVKRDSYVEMWDEVKTAIASESDIKYAVAQRPGYVDLAADAAKHLRKDFDVHDIDTQEDLKEFLKQTYLPQSKAYQSNLFGMKKSTKPAQGTSLFTSEFNVDNAVLVKAQNVYNYFVEHHETHGWEVLTNHRCSRPPFKKIMFTYDAYAYKGLKRLPDIHTCVMVQELNIESSNDPVVQNFIDKTVPYRMLLFQTALDGMIIPNSLLIAIDEQGQVLDMVNDKGERISYIKIQKDVATSKFDEVLGRDTCVALAAINFMNCKNVEIIDNVPKARHVRRAIERGRKPPVAYKTLRIIPFGRKARKADAEAQQTGIEVSLHICRGHFKDFRYSVKGLGKGHARGRWWWSPQLRGKEEVGKVVKDYEVEPKGEL